MDGCHSNGSASDGVILTSYQAVMNSGIVTPGNPDDSDLYEVLMESDPDDRMPPNGPLSSEQIQLIRTWIAQGAQDLYCDDSTGCDTLNVTWLTSIKPIITGNCEGCHVYPSPGGGILLDSYSAVQTIALNGKLTGVVEHLPGYSSMPKGGKLGDCDIAKIRIWVNAGAPNN